VPSTVARRPLPALISLLALLLLTAVVWWRVLHRSSTDSAHARCPIPTSSATPTPTATLPAPAKVTVQVLNSTKRNGLGARVSSALSDAGFNVPSQAKNDNPKTHIAGVAEIRYGPSGASGARLLRYYFPGATLVPTTSKSATVVVSLGQRYAKISTSQAVAAQLRAGRIALAISSPTPGSSPSPSATC
jgi:hypothetical protein